MSYRLLVTAVAGSLFCTSVFPSAASELAYFERSRGQMGAEAPHNARLVVIPVAFADAAPVSVTPEQLEQRVFGEANAFWQETSYGKLRLTGQVMPWLLLHTLTTCSTAATRQGLLHSFNHLIDFRQFDQVIVVAPFRQSAGGAPCAWTVQADPPATPTQTADGVVPLSFAYVHTASSTTATLAYAIGRNLGLNAAHFLNCGLENIASSNCSVDWYGDYYTVMSRPVTPRHLNAPERDQLGLFDSSRQLLTVEHSMTIPLSPIESHTAGVKGLKILRPGLQPLYVEYRQPIGADTGMDQGGFSSVFEGALLHTSWLIDPTAPSEAHRATLEVGQAFVDPSTGIRVAVFERTNATLWVQVVVPRASQPVEAPRPRQLTP